MKQAGHIRGAICGLLTPTALVIGVMSLVIAPMNHIPILSLDFVVLSFYLFVIYSLINAPIAVICVFLAKFRAEQSFFRNRTFWATFSCVSAMYFVMMTWSRYAASFRIITDPFVRGNIKPSDIFNWILVPATAIAAVLAIRDAVHLHRRKHALTYAVLAIVLFVATLGINRYFEKPYPIDLPRLMADANISLYKTEVEPAPNGQQVLVVGLDGMSWAVLAHMLEQGRLPHFRSLIESGAIGSLKTEKPTLSPRIWNTISTGLPSSEHNVSYFVQYRLAGMTRPLSVAPFLSDFAWPLALNRVLGVMHNCGLFFDILNVRSNLRIKPAVWEVATHFGKTAGVCDWWCTFPFDPTIQYMKHGHRSSSPEMEKLNEEYKVAEFEGNADRLADEYIKHRQTIVRNEKVNVAAYQRFRPDLSLNTSRLIDDTQHLFWKPRGRIWVPGHLPIEEIGPEISDAYTCADELLGDFLDAATPETVVIVVSDHGHNFNGYEHYLAPDGVIIIGGAGVKPGFLRDPSIYDVAPTILAILGIPFRADLPGRVLNEAFVEKLELVMVDDYDWYAPPEQSLIAVTPESELDKDEAEK